MARRLHLPQRNGLTPPAQRGQWGGKLVPRPPRPYGCRTTCSPRPQPLVFLWQLQQLLMWDGDPRQYCRCWFLLKGKLGVQSALKPLVPNWEAQLAQRVRQEGSNRAHRLVQHWGAWLQALVKDKNHLLARVRQELGTSGCSWGSLCPPQQRCCCFWNLPTGWAPLAGLSNLLLLLRSPSASQGRR